MKDEMVNYKEVFRKVKVITGATAEEVDKQATEFEKEHNVMDAKQYTEKMMFIFYLE